MSRLKEGSGRSNDHTHRSPGSEIPSHLRCGESIDRGLVKSLLRMLVDLQLYQEVFELEFLRETEVVYRAEALRMMRDTEFTVSGCGLGHSGRVQWNGAVECFSHMTSSPSLPSAPRLLGSRGPAVAPGERPSPALPAQIHEKASDPVSGEAADP